jgi:K+/H+ antiporter YhaU regulatory subunit KhtT
VDVIDLATRKDSAELQIEEILIETGSGLAGLALNRCGLAEMGLNVVAIKRPSGALTASPTGNAELEANSTIVVIGNRDNLDKLARMAEAKS